MLSKKTSTLLDHAISKFSPEVFSHPVWLRFSTNDLSNSYKIAEDLLDAAKNIQANDPSEACQILLLCSVCQNYAGKSNNAWTTIQDAIALARHCGLFNEVLWALWGACAISFQQGKNEQAANHLSDLEAELLLQNEWVLANFVEIIKQPLLNAEIREGNYSIFPRNRPSEDLLNLTFDWLQKWGYFAQSLTVEHSTISKNPVHHTTNGINSNWPFFSIQGWKDGWYSLMRFIKGKKVRISQDATYASKDSIFPPKNENRFPKDSSSKLRPVLKNKIVPNQAESGINVVVQMLGTFNLTIQDTLIKLPNSRGLSLLKYMFLHHKQSIPREVLMDIFWPDADPEAARNNLNVAIYSLRKELRSVTDVAVICHENGAYCLSPDLKLWLDVDEFEKRIKTGKQLESIHQLMAAVAEYEIAINLYQGDFLAEDPYEDWTVFDRERLRVAYLDTLDHLSQIYFGQERYTACVTLCQLILSHDLCREDAHYQLMQCYSRLGQCPLALRQYQICVEGLQAELGVDPAPETMQLYKRIRRHEYV